METKIDTTVKKTCRPIYRTGIVFGILLILLGGLLISTNFGFMPDNINRIIISWQMLLVVVGILSLCKRHLFSGLCLILTGGFFIIPRLAEVFPDTFSCVGSHFIADYWPVLLIEAGILIVIYWIFAPQRKFRKNHTHHHSPHNKKQFEINGEFSKSNVFGTGEYIVLEPEFKGGRLETVFGATEVDLRKASLPEGDTYLEINAVFSNITLLIPDEWKIISQLETVFSGIDDKRNIIESVDSSRRLILVGSCVFSGCEIKK